MLALEATRPKLEAEKLLEQARAGDVRLSAEGWYEATLLATGSEARAQDAAAAYVAAELKAGRTPE